MLSPTFLVQFFTFLVAEPGQVNEKHASCMLVATGKQSHLQFDLQTE